MFQEIKSHLSKKEMSLIVGSRQVGKTTLMQLLKDYLDKKGEATLFLSLDSELDRQHFASQMDLVRKIDLEIGERRGYVFIDEIQRKENSGIFLKGIYDLGLPHKFILSGSGSLELKQKIHESLVGRKRIFPVDPVSFEEYVDFKTGYKYEGKLRKFFDVERRKTEGFLSEYLNFGGYPRIVAEGKAQEKKKCIEDIFHSYVEKDISYLLRVRKIDEYTSLIKILASQIGRLSNYTELSSTVGISMQTLANYLWYGEKTFVIHRLRPHFKNVRKEITKSPKIYFYDLGLRNYPLGLFGNVNNPGEFGLLFENFVFNILKEKLGFRTESLRFWRTKEKAEVDFVVESGMKVVPIEVKYKLLDKVEVNRSLRSFIEAYKPELALIVNLGLDRSLKIGKTKVRAIPFWKLFHLTLFD
jgi:predicted AAA+ superfamily ATPase